MSRALVLIPTYNTGPRLDQTVREVLGECPDVLVVDDASTDGAPARLRELTDANPGLRLVTCSENGGKGEAVLAGAREALRLGFDHALVFDADGQHPAAQIKEFLALSAANPGQLILGVPVFGSEAPKVRLYGRKLSVGLVNLETGFGKVSDPLFGFRVYPLEPLVAVLESTRWARRYDFDPEVAVRLVWRGVKTVNREASCRYLSREEGGVSHFKYARDNVRMVGLHVRLLTEWLCLRWWRL